MSHTSLIAAMEAQALVELRDHSVPFQGKGSSVMGCPWLRFTSRRLREHASHAFVLLEWGAAGQDMQSIDDAVAYLDGAFAQRHSLAELRRHCGNDQTVPAIMSHPEMGRMMEEGSCVIVNAIWGLGSGGSRRSRDIPARLRSGWVQVAPIIEACAPATVVFMHSELHSGQNPPSQKFSRADKTYPLADAWAAWRRYMKDSTELPSWVQTAAAMDVAHPQTW